MNKTYQQLIQSYREKGIKKGVELLLLPEQAIMLIDELVEVGIRILGCDSWCYVDSYENDPNRVLEIVGGGVLVELPEDSSVIEDANFVKEFILEKLPEDAKFVSLIYDEPS